MEQPVRLRLSIWRPAKLERPIDYAASLPNEAGERTPESGIQFAIQRLHEEIYRWSSDVDVFSGLSNSTLSMQVSEWLLTRFNSALPPEQRNMTQFGTFVAELKAIAEQPTQTLWLDWPHPTPEEAATTGLIRISPLVAFYHHLAWVHATFQHVPGASVTFR